jgi:hypothetical protein
MLQTLQASIQQLAKLSNTADVVSAAQAFVNRALKLKARGAKK